MKKDINDKISNPLFRYIQIELFDALYNQGQTKDELDKSLRFVELCALQLALGKSEFNFKELAEIGMLCPNDWKRFENAIKRDIPAAKSYKYVKELYKRLR